jgi:hypothetical protein
LLQLPRLFVKQLVLHRQVADLGLEPHHLLVAGIRLSRLQRRLGTGEKVIAQAATVAAVTPSSRETTPMSSPRSKRRMALVLRRAE